MRNGMEAMEHRHKSERAMASNAKQTTLACESVTYGSPCRCAPRDDRLMQIFPQRPQLRCHLLG
jgi:hypothetical protein